MSARVIHCCIDLDYIVHRGGAREMAGYVRQAGRLLSEPELIAMAAVLKARGFDAMPTCDNHDALGHCKGCAPAATP